MNDDRFFRVFDFIFAQPGWLTKFGIGIGLYLLSLFIPVVPLIPLIGYTALIMRAVIETDVLTLPEWDNWSNLFTEGLRVLGVGLVAYLPIFLAMGLMFAVMFAPMFLSIVMVEASNAPEEWIFFGSMAGLFLGLALLMLVLALALIVAVLAPPALAHAVARRQWLAAFRLGEWWPVLRANLAGFIIATGLLWAVGLAFGLLSQVLALTLVLICLLPFLVFPYTVYTLWVSAALYGQAYRDGAQRLAQTQP